MSTPPRSPEPASLDKLLQAFADLNVGTPYPVTGNFFKTCGSTDLALIKKLKAVPGSLAGVQVKSTAREWPFLRCNGCGRESEGK